MGRNLAAGRQDQSSGSRSCSFKLKGWGTTEVLCLIENLSLFGILCSFLDSFSIYLTIKNDHRL